MAVDALKTLSSIIRVSSGYQGTLDPEATFGAPETSADGLGINLGLSCVKVDCSSRKTQLTYWEWVDLGRKDERRKQTEGLICRLIFACICRDSSTHCKKPCGSGRRKNASKRTIPVNLIVGCIMAVQDSDPHVPHLARSVCSRSSQ